jgi:hypothetical protein
MYQSVHFKEKDRVSSVAADGAEAAARLRPSAPALAATALLASMLVGVTAGSPAASYCAAALAIASAGYLFYRLVLFRIRVQSEVLPFLDAAHRLTPTGAFRHWLGAELSNLGSVRPGTVDAAMHAELGTLTSERLAKASK